MIRTFKSRLVIAIALSSFTSPFAQAALLEVRAGYDILRSNPKDLNESGIALPEFKEMKGFSVDAVTFLPAMPVGFGIRYERFSNDGSNDFGSFEGKFERTSLVVSRRFGDTRFYAGGILTAGLVNQLDYDTTIAGAKTSYKATSALTGSAGVEGGVSLGFLKIGLELGYLYAPLGNLKYGNGTDVVNGDGSNTKVDLSAPYARASIGIGF